MEAAFTTVAAAPMDEISWLQTLSQRESELIRLAADGCTDGGIAKILGISSSTVKTYWGRLRIKVGPFSRTEIVARVLHARAIADQHDLRAENATLRAQLHAKVAAIDEDEACHDAMRSAPDAMMIVSPTGQIITANECAGELFGYEPARLATMAIQHLVPERYREHHRQLMIEYSASPTRRAMADHTVAFALHASGAEIPIEASLSTFLRRGIKHIVCSVRRTRER